MNYALCGHELKHAAEEMLYHLLPAEQQVRVDEAALIGDWCKSSLVRQGDLLAATAEISLGGKQGSAVCSRTLAPDADALTEKRAATELVRFSIYDALVPKLVDAPAWGSLTGVRPAKLARNLLAHGLSLSQVEQQLIEYYRVSPARARVTMDALRAALAADQRLAENGISLYVGIPFCPSRCYYCSFVCSTTAQTGYMIPDYLAALCKEIEQTAQYVRQNGLVVQSLYIGGGTPTTLSAEQLSVLCDRLARCFDLSQLVEYTVEAGRPDTIDRARLTALKNAGVTRISINPQSMNEQVLRKIGRGHSAGEVREAYALSRKLCFAQINMDLIAGLDGDDADSFAASIDEVIALSPENITVHSLAIKRGADLTDRARALQIRNTVAEMLSYAEARLRAAGYTPYYLYRQKFSAGGFENIGWCKAGDEGFYNIVMMEELQTVLSLGAGGVSKRVVRQTGEIHRVANPKYPIEYIREIDRLAGAKQGLLLR